MKTGLLIKELRIKKGLTQGELAEKTELSTRTIQRIENGEVDPRAYTLQVIARALDVEFSLFNKDDSDAETDVEKDSKRTWLAMLHLSALLPLFLPSYIIWNRKKADIKEMTEHYRSVLAFQATILFMCLIGLWVLYNTQNPRAILFFLLLGAIFSAKNTFKVLNGKPYKYFDIFRGKRNKTKTTLK